MTFLNRFKFAAVAVLTVVTLLASCENDLTTIGSGVVGKEPFNTDKAVFDVFATNKKIEAVRTNQLPIYQLGVFTDPVYGRTEATVTSQVQLTSPNPIFGDKNQAKETSDATPENETVESVFLYIPFLQSPSGDTDGDGLIDELDSEPTNPNSDTDGDGLTDNQERARGSNPLDATDAEAENFVKDQFARNFDVDSIYGNREMPFTLRLQRSDFFLRDLDPASNFQEAQEYYSNQDFSPFLTEEIATVSATIDEKEILLPRVDDPETEEINEATLFTRVPPGIRVELPKAFFQENILDKEGSSELLTQANFKEFLRGINLSLQPAAGEEVMLLFDLRNASISISYGYTVGAEAKKKDFTLNFITQQATNTQTGQTFPVIGNAVNSFVNEPYAPAIADAIASEDNAERIYIKGGAGSYAEINLFNIDNGKEIINRIKANNWIVNEASLVFYVDATPGVIYPPRLYLYSTETNVPLISVRNDSRAAQGFSKLRSFPFYGGLLEGTGSEQKYTVKITDYINDLIIRDATNATLGLTITPNIEFFNIAEAMLENDTETNLPVGATLSPLGTVLFGSDVSTENTGKKLQLEIFYTEAN